MRDERKCAERRGEERLRVQGADVRGLVPCVRIGAAASHCVMSSRWIGGAIGVGGLTLRKLPELTADVAFALTAQTWRGLN